VVPAPPDGSGDELRHPANGRATGALDLRRPPQPLTRYLDPGRRISQSLDPRPTSRHYGYTEALPAAWIGGQATQQCDGKGAPGDQDSVVDLFQGPGGAEARAIAPPTKQNLAAYARPTTGRHRTSVPGGPATRPGGHDRRSTPGCLALPARERLPAELAVTTHDGTAFVIASKIRRGRQPPSRPPRRLPYIPRRHKASAVRAGLESPKMPGRWLLPLGAGSQPRLNLPTPLTAQPPAITDGSVRRQPDNLCSRRRYIPGAR
jgi:hypothetical protein